MSMITGCPACGTLFRVVPDQLKISDGWVRCGHCSEVFDAAAHLQAGESATPAADSGLPTTEPQPLEDAAPPTQVPAHAAAAEQHPVPPQPFYVRETASPGPDSRPGDEPLPSSTFHASIPAGATRPAGLEDEPAYATQVDSVLSEARASRPFIPEDDDPPLLDDPALDDVSFVQQGRRRLFWRRPLVRGVLAVLALVLAVLLAAQLAVHDRDRLAAQHPDWKPSLARLCDLAGCRLGPPRRIDAIAIDSSGFTRIRQDLYRLTVTLKNQAPQPVAVPALELTLTDGQDQLVLRRVLTPRDLGAPADALSATSDWSASVAVAISAGGARIAGYRLLAFYP